MNIKTITIDSCSQCSFYIHDDNDIVERYGKSWCQKLDKELNDNKGLENIPIPDDCPLE